MNMRKIIAVLAAVLLLCAAIPMAAISVSAAANLVPNGTFDSNTSGWGKSTNTVLTTDTGVTGNALKATHADDWAYVYTWMDVEANTDYTISFKAKADKGSFSINFKDNGWAAAGIDKLSPSISTVWKEYSLDFNTGDFSGRLLIFFSSNQYGSAAQSIWLDDVVVSLKKTSLAPEGAIYFEDFEDDHTWASASTATAEVVDASAAPVAGVNSQNKVYMHTIPDGAYPYISDTKSIAVTPNTDYVLQFDALNTSANWPVQGIIAENYWLGGAFFTTSSQNIKPRTDAWETYSVVFNSGNHSSINVGIKSQWSNTTIYVDNVAIIPLDKAVKNDGYVKNGDFETGDALEWLHADSTKVVKDLNGNQGYVMETAELVSGGHLFSQPVSNLVVGEEYVLSFKVNCYSASTGNSAFWVQFPSAFTTWSVDTTLGAAKANNYTPRINVTTNVNAWYDVNITFTAQAETALIRFLNYRGNQGYYFFDDIAITHVHKWADATCTAPKTCSVCGETEGDVLPHTYANDYDADCDVCGAIRDVVNPIAFGGNSRSDDVSGLAFLFNVAVDGMAVNGTEAIYDGATIDGNKLISMGAIVSNAKSELDIPAVYLCDLEADSASFAVRIINIPEANYGDEITAVPYFVVEIDGVQTTIYGEAQVATYNG